MSAENPKSKVQNPMKRSKNWATGDKAKLSAAAKRTGMAFDRKGASGGALNKRWRMLLKERDASTQEEDRW